MKINARTVNSPVSSSLYRGDTGVCGPSSAPNNSYKRCGHMVSSQAHRTTCVIKQMQQLYFKPIISELKCQLSMGSSPSSVRFLPHAERALKIIRVQQVFGNTSAGFVFDRLFLGAFCNTYNANHTKTTKFSNYRTVVLAKKNKTVHSLLTLFFILATSPVHNTVLSVWHREFPLQQANLLLITQLGSWANSLQPLFTTSQSMHS